MDFRRLFSTRSLPMRHYLRSRKLLVQLNSQITEEYMTPEIIEEIVDWFGVREDNQLVLENETEMDIFNDFFVHEFYDPDSRSTIELARIDYADEVNDEKAALLSAMSRSECVVVRILDTNPKKYVIEAKILRGSSPEKIIINDRGLSASLAPDMLLFARLIPYSKDAYMTSGAGFLFDSVYERHVKELYDKTLKDYPTPPKTTQFLWRRFLYLNREIGHPLAFHI